MTTTETAGNVYSTFLPLYGALLLDVVKFD